MNVTLTRNFIKMVLVALNYSPGIPLQPVVMHNYHSTSKQDLKWNISLMQIFQKAITLRYLKNHNSQFSWTVTTADSRFLYAS